MKKTSASIQKKSEPQISRKEKSIFKIDDQVSNSIKEDKSFFTKFVDFISCSNTKTVNSHAELNLENSLRASLRNSGEFSAAIKSEMNQKLDNIISEKQKLISDQKAKESEIKNLNNQLNTLTKRFNESNLEVKNLKSKIKDLENQNITMNKNLEIEKTRIKDKVNKDIEKELNDRIKNRNLKIEKQKKRIDELEKQLKDSQDKFDIEINRLLSELDLEKKSKKSFDKFKSNQLQLFEKQKEDIIESYKSKISNSTKTLDKLNQDLSDEKAKNQELINTLEITQKDLQHYKRKYTKKELKSQQVLKNLNQEFESRIRQLESENQSITKQIEKLSNENQDLKFANITKMNKLKESQMGKKHYKNRENSLKPSIEEFNQDKYNYGPSDDIQEESTQSTTSRDLKKVKLLEERNNKLEQQFEIEKIKLQKQSKSKEIEFSVKINQISEENEKLKNMIKLIENQKENLETELKMVLSSSFNLSAEDIEVDDKGIDQMNSQDLKKCCAELLKKNKIYLKNNSKMSHLLKVSTGKANDIEENFKSMKNELEKTKNYYDRKIDSLNSLINDKVVEKNYEDEIRLLQIKLELSERKIKEFENELIKLNSERKSDDSARNMINEFSKYNEENSFIRHQLQKVYFA